MAQTDPLTSISAGVHSYLLDDELLLFSEHDRNMYRLNSSSAFIWCCCEEAMDYRSITTEFAQTFKLPASRAEAVVRGTLSEWSAMGFIGQESKPLPSEPVSPTEQQNTADHASPVIDANEHRHEHRYKLLETVFRMRFSAPDMAPIAHAVFAHLEVPDDEPYSLTLDVHRHPDGYTLYSDGEPAEHCVTAEELAPLLHSYVALEVYSRAEYLIAIHAAAVRHGKKCIVLPAKAGNGKSTLTGALIGSGFQYCTDELVLLKHKSHTVQAVPVGLALKPGSWPILKPYHPELERLPVFLRPDEKHVRYLLPEKHALARNPAQCYPVHSLVFPVYQATRTTGLSRISPADALCRITEAGYEVEGDLDREKVAELVDWICGIGCYELCVNDLQEAVSRITELLQ